MAAYPSMSKLRLTILCPEKRFDAFAITDGLSPQVIPAIRWVTALEHLAEDSVSVLFAVIGALGGFVVDPGVDEDLARKVVAKEQPVLLVELCPAPMGVLSPESVSLAILRACRVLWNVVLG